MEVSVKNQGVAEVLHESHGAAPDISVRCGKACPAAQQSIYGPHKNVQNVADQENGIAGALTKEWGLSGVHTASSGTPQAITIIPVSDYLGGGDAGRVNLTYNPALPRGERTADKFFKTSCVSLPARGDYGNASKDICRRPGRISRDMILFRNFNLGSERRVLIFRWDRYSEGFY